MAGYVVQARVERPRLRAVGLAAGAWTDRARVAAPDADGPPAAETTGPTPAERWEDARRIWRQTTFYLFDPDSWR